MEATLVVGLFGRRGACAQVCAEAREPATGVDAGGLRKAGGGVGGGHDVFLYQFCGVMWPGRVI